MRLPSAILINSLSSSSFRLRSQLPPPETQDKLLATFRAPNTDDGKSPLVAATAKLSVARYIRRQNRQRSVLCHSVWCVQRGRTWRGLCCMILVVCGIDRLESAHSRCPLILNFY